MQNKHRQHGGTLLGLILGLVIGLGIALGVVIFITKAPIPFVDRAASRSALQDQAESERNRDWDPNAALRSQNEVAPLPPPASPGTVESESLDEADPAAILAGRLDDVQGAGDVPLVQAQGGKARPVPSNPQASPGEDPLGDLLASRSGAGNTAPSAPAADPFVYYVQAGAYRSRSDADAQRARLSLSGVQASVTQREQAGQAVYRVRTGPFLSRQEARQMQARLERGGVDSALVRVQR